MPAVNRYYSSVAVDTTLSFSISSTDLSLVVGSTAGFPTSYPYTLAIGYDLNNEELVTIVGASGTTLTIGTTVAGGANIAGRGVDGTNDQAHVAGEAVKHVISARDMTEAQAHIAAESGAHGVTGAIVGTTDLQTLSSKTLASPTITGTITGAVVTSANIVDGTIVNADINASAAIADTKLDTIATAGKVSNSATTATSANTASAIVARDSSGNFSAGTVTANLTGNVTGNATTATSFQTARNINGVSFNGTADITVADSTKLPTAGGTVTGALNVNGNLYATNGLLFLGANDYIEFNEGGNLFYFRADGAAGAGISAGYGGFSRIDSDGDITTNTDVFASGDIGSYGVISNPWVELATALCRPKDDNDTALGSVGTTPKRWTRVFAVNTTISSSDERDKLDINDSPLGLDFINDLRPVSYRWKVGEKKTIIDQEGNPVLDADGNKTYEVREGVRKHYGLISQEVKQALDNSGVDDFAGWVQDDLSDPDSHQSISYEQFIAPLIKSVQELSAEVQTLKAKVAELEAK
jgi:hypothetical protein